MWLKSLMYTVLVMLMKKKCFKHLFVLSTCRQRAVFISFATINIDSILQVPLQVINSPGFMILCSSHPLKIHLWPLSPFWPTRTIHILPKITGINSYKFGKLTETKVKLNYESKKRQDYSSGHYIHVLPVLQGPVVQKLINTNPD